MDSEPQTQPDPQPETKPAAPPVGRRILLGLAVVLGSALIWALALWAVRRWAGALPVIGFFLPIAAIGLPAFFAAALAYRWRLWQPVVWSTVGYCLGSGIATAIDQAQYLQSQGTSPAFGQLAQTVLVHAATLTVFGPATPGPWMQYWGNLLWVVVAVASGLYGIETYRGRGPLDRKR